MITKIEGGNTNNIINDLTPLYNMKTTTTTTIKITSIINLMGSTKPSFLHAIKWSNGPLKYSTIVIISIIMTNNNDQNT
ncbi:hypothetical protein DERP_001912 [Dermatophagoides pteronyssinus]|uniref:Uncharacterized protein n=1 Tax=Dermatophagoides pteronyssinus TaxID=6956 RepID=A0ABQ8JCD5_DERPT|nr:hypothetical protein DERP_001912 [Dermatophagoides pteronyssinus]